MAMCPVCDGTGLLPSDVCPLCDGQPLDEEMQPTPTMLGPAAEEQVPIAVPVVQDPAPIAVPAAENLAQKKRPIQAAPKPTTETRFVTAGMHLAGQPLEPPRFFAVNWRPGQTFRPEDDPDRMSQPWSMPSFCSRDPALQRASLVVRELNLPSKPNAYSFARVVHNVLNEEECAELIRLVNVKGFTPALKNHGTQLGCQKLQPKIRDGWRVIVDCDPLTSWLLEVLRPYLPEELPSFVSNSRSTGTAHSGIVAPVRLHGLNERCRFLCYLPGQQFKKHRDSSFQHLGTGATSCVTIQIYLHDVPEANGGATTFLEGRSVSCQPGAGAALVFTQDLAHEGSLLKQGLKYTFRTEAMYTRHE